MLPCFNPKMLYLKLFQQNKWNRKNINKGFKLLIMKKTEKGHSTEIVISLSSTPSVI